MNTFKKTLALVVCASLLTGPVAQAKDEQPAEQPSKVKTWTKRILLLGGTTSVAYWYLTKDNKRSRSSSGRGSRSGSGHPTRGGLKAELESVELKDQETAIKLKLFQYYEQHMNDEDIVSKRNSFGTNSTYNATQIGVLSWIETGQTSNVRIVNMRSLQLRELADFLRQVYVASLHTSFNENWSNSKSSVAGNHSEKCDRFMRLCTAILQRLNPNGDNNWNLRNDDREKNQRIADFYKIFKAPSIF